LESFAYKNTTWYQTINSENRTFKHNLILVTLTAYLVGLVGFIAIACISGRFASLPLYGFYFAVLLALLAYHVFFRKIRLMVNLALVMPFVFLLATVYLPSERFMYLPVLALYPVFAMHLRGTRQGFAWFASFIALFVASYCLQGASEILRWSVSISPAEFAGGVCTTLVVCGFSCITEKRQEKMVESLTDRFVFDDVTGLPGKEAMVHSIDPGRTYFLAIIKIENFSNLVALFGYDFSDTISQFASRKLVKYEEKFGYKTFQLKYNEYGILADRPGALTTVDIAQFLGGLVKALEVESLPWERDRISLVYCVGGTIVSPCDAQSPFSRADIALKKAERSHAVITIFEDDIDEKENAYDYVKKFSELVTNRENESFRAVFQPVFNSDGTRIEWYEALLRIQHADGSYGSISPYLSVAKSTGFYQYLTDFIVRESARMIIEHDVNISINIAIHDILRPEFILLVDEIFAMIRDRNGRIIFEILESDELVELNQCVWFIDYIARYGFKIAIDDFGTGYSNYSSLINLPIDIVKIDGSLIRKIHEDENAKILVEGIVQFCGKSNKKTVAEYVESEAVFDSLRSLGIDFLQGYYLAEPASISVVAV
jgi:EAL domain-containing protein (putative c-di-GMP-specific phosphodiesterase class I)/GGDEF domain-containing protein